MYSNNRIGSRAARARGFMALCAVLALGLGSMASPAEAAPFAYVTNGFDSVLVIDTATNKVVGRPIPVGINCTPLQSPSHRMGNTPMSRMKTQAATTSW